MSYRIWWLIAFWALGIGVAIEMQRPDREGKADSRAASHVVPAPVAAQPAASRGG
jgi:hypothetical protein